METVNIDPLDIKPDLALVKHEPESEPAGLSDCSNDCQEPTCFTPVPCRDTDEDPCEVEPMEEYNCMLNTDESESQVWSQSDVDPIDISIKIEPKNESRSIEGDLATLAPTLNNTLQEIEHCEDISSVKLLNQSVTVPESLGHVELDDLGARITPAVKQCNSSSHSGSESADSVVQERRCECGEPLGVTQSEIRRHWQKHWLMKPLKCDYCPCIFRTAERLSCHVEGAHVADVLMCDHCDHVFKSVTLLKHHMFKTHARGRPSRSNSPDNAHRTLYDNVIAQRLYDNVIVQRMMHGNAIAKRRMSNNVTAQQTLYTGVVAQRTMYDVYIADLERRHVSVTVSNIRPANSRPLGASVDSTEMTNSISRRNNAVTILRVRTTNTGNKAKKRPEKRQGKGLFACRLCFKRFNCVTSVKRHLKTNHSTTSERSTMESV